MNDDNVIDLSGNTTTRSENENCLQGMKCPECGALEPFDIDVVTTVRMWDEGSDIGFGADINWDEDSDCYCENCGHAGKVRDFQEVQTDSEDTGASNSIWK